MATPKPTPRRKKTTPVSKPQPLPLVAGDSEPLIVAAAVALPPLAMTTKIAGVAADRVEMERVFKAVDSLLKWESSRSQKRLKTSQPLLLLDQEADRLLYLTVSLKKMPEEAAVLRTNPYQIPIPHPLFGAGGGEAGQEICLIVDDRQGAKRKEAKQRVLEENLPVSKVLGLSKLRTDYKAFEAKRKLCGSFDLFLADKAVLPMLPKLLGKEFFKKKKHPIPVDLSKRDWKKQIQDALGSTFLYLKGGTCSVLKVGRWSQPREEIAENVAAAIRGVASVVPKKWKNIRSLYLKTLDSVALPLFQSLPDLPMKIITPLNNKPALLPDVEKTTAKSTKIKLDEPKPTPVDNKVRSDLDSDPESDTVQPKVVLKREKKISAVKKPKARKASQEADRKKKRKSLS